MQKGGGKGDPLDLSIDSSPQKGALNLIDGTWTLRACVPRALLHRGIITSRHVQDLKGTSVLCG